MLAREILQRKLESAKASNERLAQEIRNEATQAIANGNLERVDALANFLEAVSRKQSENSGGIEESIRSLELVNQELSNVHRALTGLSGDVDELDREVEQLEQHNEVVKDAALAALASLNGIQS